MERSEAMAKVKLSGFLTLSEVAKRKETTRQAVWRAIKKGLLDYVDLSGRTLVVDNEKLARWEPDRLHQKIAEARWKKFDKSKKGGRLGHDKSLKRS
jgi:predicted DNA-binding protein YlxM (UPF0122 family)